MFEKLFNNIYLFVNFIIYKTIKKKITKDFFFQFWRFYLVQGSITLLNYSIFNFLKCMNWDTKVANFITFVFIFFLNFFLQKYYTYRSTKRTILQLILFIINSIVYFSLDTIILVVLIDMFFVKSFISKIISIIILAPYSFVVQKFLIFKKL